MAAAASHVIRSFNTAGPCDASRDYMLPAMARLPEVRGLIERSKYFVVHAPRQVGKTTALLSLAEELTAEGRVTALLVSVEVGSPFTGNIEVMELAILDAWRGTAEARLPPDLRPPPWPVAPAGSRIGAALRAWALASPRPLVLFIDEIDSLKDAALLSVLRQLRDGYANRPKAFPMSIALIGMRDVRDYKIAANDLDRAGTASPFNILTRSLMVRNFTRDEVSELYTQHTAETGQAFSPNAVDRAFQLSNGQPWIVNSLAAVAVDELATDRAVAITPDHIDRAKEILLRRQETHLDSLVARLREPRVKSVLEPMLAGAPPTELAADDVRFLLDIGLVNVSGTGGLEVSNPIYREVILRELAFTMRASLPSIQPTWLLPSGRIDADKLLDAFMVFWRKNGEPLLRTAMYHEIAPHLVLMAFLDRVVNGGGTLEREVAIGSGRMDLCLRYGPDVLAMELKVWRDKEADPVEEGLAQLDRYLAGLGLDRGWLVIFDRRTGAAPLAERTRAERRETPAGRAATVLRG